MKILYKALLIFALVFLFPKNAMSKSIQEIAKEVQKEFVKNLPQKISQNMIITEVIALDDTIVLKVFLSYDREFLEKSAVSNGATMQDMKNIFYSHMKKSSCSREVNRAFIRLGGKLHYDYNFKDSEHFMVVKIEKCS